MASAANRTITGVVISGEDNEPLIGASVYVHTDELKKNGSSEVSLGTVTDIDGKFSLSIPEKTTRIHCSYIGFEEQILLFTFCFVHPDVWIYPLHQWSVHRTGNIKKQSDH